MVDFIDTGMQKLISRYNDKCLNFSSDYVEK
jgi:hypothetical protein